MLRRVLIGTAVAGLANFFVFMAITLWNGGAAIDGFVRDGHYFVSSHGHVSEIGALNFRLSRWQGYSIFVTHPLAILCMWLSGCRFVRGARHGDA